mmetsp:Transcript_18377/g.31204  ORF Transcript_18377/g.31204 Transcript_18377/m.31204 type:complete len:519 (-) Transcript_18377:271-1827(-)
MLTGGHQAGDVCNVCHQNGTNFIRDFSELGKIDDPRIGGGSTKDHGWAEDQGRFAQLCEIDEASLRVHPVGQGLEIDGSCTDLLPGSVVAMGQMTSTGQIQAHDPGMRRKKGRVHGKVCRTATVRLNIHTPFLLIEAEGLQCPILAEILHFVNDLVSAVVAISWLSLRVFVGQSRAQALHDSARGEVFGGNEFDAPGLSCLFLLHQLVHEWINLGQGPVARQGRAVPLGAGGDPLGRDHKLGISLNSLEGSRLGIVDLPQTFQDANHHLLQVQGVEVQTRCSTLQQLAAHVHTLTDTKLLEGLIRGVGLLSSLQETLRQPGLAELGHAFQATQTIETHDARNDGNLDVIFAALFDEVQEDLGVEEHLSNHKVSSRIDLFLQVHHLLVKVGIAANGDNFLVVLIFHHTGATPLTCTQSGNSPFNLLNVVRVAFRIAGHGNGEVISMVLADELHQVQGTVEATFSSCPLLLTTGRITSQGHDVAHTQLPALLQSVAGHFGALVGAGQVHIGHAAELVLGS